jgi:NitT/TauT family transport system substrate-binding protein
MSKPEVRCKPWSTPGSTSSTFMEENPDRANEIMAQRANVSTTTNFGKYLEGTRFFTLEENLEAFTDGDSYGAYALRRRENVGLYGGGGLHPRSP